MRLNESRGWVLKPEGRWRVSVPTKVQLNTAGNSGRAEKSGEGSKEAIKEAIGRYEEMVEMTRNFLIIA